MKKSAVKNKNKSCAKELKPRFHTSQVFLSDLLWPLMIFEIKRYFIKNVIYKKYIQKKLIYKYVIELQIKAFIILTFVESFSKVYKKLKVDP